MDIKKEKYIEILANTRLFLGAKKETLEYAYKSSDYRKCNKGECIFDSKTTPPSLFIILEGSASVYGTGKLKPVILNTLKRGRVFGMASLFGDTCGATKIIAKENCCFAVITQENVEKMLSSDIDFTKNYICFLSDKIRFLNKKIVFFTSGSTEKTVASYILSLPFNKTDSTVTLDINLSKLAQNLDIGRASLYRALDSLEENGFIEKQNNVIKITSYDEFKKIYGENL
ncbi:MAG: Crp/Fnr family transcriptional regulator [Ruminococcaceae bacterium]|nr:Crp/Fnr family transcriptional regulator [Oscillospiraceae bacterium]